MTPANDGSSPEKTAPLPDVDGFKWLMGGSGKEPKRKTGWASMNRIQKAGAITFICLMPGAFGKNTLGLLFALASWSSLFTGYVAGSLWKVRHALHFWWSLAAALLAHAAVLPAYVYLIHLLNTSPHSSGRGIIYLLGGLLSVEVLTFLFILKRIALWLHRRAHPHH